MMDELQRKEGIILGKNIIAAATNPDEQTRHYAGFSFDKENPTDLTLWVSGTGVALNDLEHFADLLIRFCDSRREEREWFT